MSFNKFSWNQKDYFSFLSSDKINKRGYCQSEIKLNDFIISQSINEEVKADIDNSEEEAENYCDEDRLSVLGEYLTRDQVEKSIDQIVDDMIKSKKRKFQKVSLLLSPITNEFRVKIKSLRLEFSLFYY